jgi:hypothetical protein
VVSARRSTLRRVRAARRQRGAAVMLVVLVLTMLMGIGLFAARTAQLSIGASGYDRQMTQTHYVAQYGIIAATSELSTSRLAGYIRTMAMQPDAQCSQGLLQLYVPDYTCYRFGYQDLQAQAGQPFMPAVPRTALGNPNIEADWLVEMSDLAPAAPVAGMDLTSAGASNLRFMAVTLTSTGQVRPISAGSTANQTSAASASIETQRAHLLVGPLPKF